MHTQLDLATAEFVVEVKATSAARLKLSWPQDAYYDLVRSPVTILQMEATQLFALAQAAQPTYPDTARVEALKTWFVDAAAGTRRPWPAMPVLLENGGELTFVEGRHRCAALVELGAVRIPVIVG